MIYRTTSDSSNYSSSGGFMTPKEIAQEVERISKVVRSVIEQQFKKLEVAKSDKNNFKNSEKSQTGFSEKHTTGLSEKDNSLPSC